ncbi:MAG TPA: hypothetical protein VN915_01410 [Elusimicrobiota bacterium]|nr:hypothetical protein [Elusimicrobiota bacterium]
MWFRFDEERNPRAPDEPDVIYRESQRILRARITHSLLPLFEKIHATDPHALSRSHILWLQRSEMDDLRFWQYLHWLIPQLKDSIFGIKSSAGLKFLREIEDAVHPPQDPPREQP